MKKSKGRGITLSNLKKYGADNSLIDFYHTYLKGKSSDAKVELIYLKGLHFVEWLEVKGFFCYFDFSEINYNLAINSNHFKKMMCENTKLNKELLKEELERRCKFRDV